MHVPDRRLSPTLLFLVLGAMACTGGSHAANELSQSLTWIPFEWESKEFPGGQVEKTAMFVPLTLDEVPHEFLAQFDLGVNQSVLYMNPITPYLAAYPQFGARLDTTQTSASARDEMQPSFTDLTFWLGPVRFERRGLASLAAFGDEIDPDSIDTPTPKKVGTIGADLFQDTTLIIDYPNQRMAMLGELPAAIASQVTFVDMKLDRGKIKVPISIEGKSYDVLFDTGSSMFPLLVSTADWQRFRDTAASVDTLQISSWGTMIDVYGSQTEAGVYIGDLRFEGERMFGIPHPGFANYFKAEGILGLMGNALFLNHQIIIDFSNRRFGVATGLFPRQSR